MLERNTSDLKSSVRGALSWDGCAQQTAWVVVILPLFSLSNRFNEPFQPMKLPDHLWPCWTYFQCRHHVQHGNTDSGVYNVMTEEHTHVSNLLWDFTAFYSFDLWRFSHHR